MKLQITSSLDVVKFVNIECIVKLLLSFPADTLVLLSAKPRNKPTRSQTNQIRKFYSVILVENCYAQSWTYFRGGCCLMSLGVTNVCRKCSAGRNVLHGSRQLQSLDSLDSLEVVFHLIMTT